MTTTSNNVTSASLLGSKVTSYESTTNATTSKSGKEMGKQDFLTLFTAQLQNQNPLDPVKNEAFVAQLAQFSQLEATTNMQTSMDNLVKSLAGERMLNSASLIGLKVAIPDSLSRLDAGGSIEGKIDLPDGASGIMVKVYNEQGGLVQELSAGPQSPGTASLTWDGKDALGNAAPAGLYRLKASAVVNGKTSDVSVNTLATVRSVASNSTDGSVSLEVEGGKTVLLSTVQRVAY
jgi:flagellar basal-body rod modification protein FlgD